MAVFGFGRRNAVGRQYNGGNVSVMLPRYTTPPERNTRDWLEMFGRNPRLAVVDRIASDLSTCTGKLYRKDENGEEVEITDHPFLNFMAHPNPLYEMTSGACWRLQQIYLELKGEGYFVYEFDALGRPVELWPSLHIGCSRPPMWATPTMKSERPADSSGKSRWTIFSA